MTPVSPVMPGSESIEVVMGRNQRDYDPLPVVYLEGRSGVMVSRFRLTAEEQAAVAAGGDIVLQQVTCWKPYQGVHLQVCAPDEMPVLLEMV